MTSNGNLIWHARQRGCNLSDQGLRFALHTHRTRWKHRKVCLVNDLDPQALLVSGDGDLIFQATNFLVLRQFLFDFGLEFFEILLILLSRNFLFLLIRQFIGRAFAVFTRAFAALTFFAWV